MTKPVRLVVLDRDGVINEAPSSYVVATRDWVPIAGSLEAIAALGRAGYRVCVATNQSCVGRGLVSTAVVEDIHREMCERVAAHGGRIDRVWYCPHRPDEGCDCRKPASGMLRDIGEYYGVAMNGVPVVGDAPTDLRAANAVGARPILVLTGKGRDTWSALGESAGLEVYADLCAVSRMLVAEAGG
jgi:D-glycero-D-manno-heptose 1,7-bisphosphate phosphatase